MPRLGKCLALSRNVYSAFPDPEESVVRGGVGCGVRCWASCVRFGEMGEALAEAAIQPHSPALISPLLPISLTTYSLLPISLTSASLTLSIQTTFPRSTRSPLLPLASLHSHKSSLSHL